MRLIHYNYDMDSLFGRWLNKKAPEIKKEIEPDPGELTMDNAYKTRWIWYHTILALELLLVNVLLIAILVVISVKL